MSHHSLTCVSETVRVAERDISSSDIVQFGHCTRVGNSLRPEAKTSRGFLHDAQTSRTRLPMLLCEKEGAQPWKALPGG